MLNDKTLEICNQSVEIFKAIFCALTELGYDHSYCFQISTELSKIVFMELYEDDLLQIREFY